jgi:aldehyde:ferredoxin oxidoreductase
LKGWNGQLLRVDLTKGKALAEKYSADLATRYVGGRGFAVKLLWDELKPGTDPLGPNNIIVFAVGPLTAFMLPNSGKMVVASKSPLTGGYGDGNIGTMASVNLRKAGFDAVVVTGRAEKPSYLMVNDEKAEIKGATDIWGLDAFRAETKLKEEHGSGTGVILIGPAGENRALITTVVSQEGRAGGRPGIGAVMGSKNLKALVIQGTGEPIAANPNELKKIGQEGYRAILDKDNYKFWKRQGTMATVEWCQEHSTLPTHNFKEGIFDGADAISGTTMEKMVSKQRGCPSAQTSVSET